MKRLLLLGAASTLALLFVAWARGSGGGPPTLPEPPEVRHASPVPSSADDRLPTLAAPRNLFEYGHGARPATSAPFTEVHRLPPPSPEADPSREPVRLVGVLRQNGQARAALSVLGEVVILAPGQMAFGYTLLAVDEDAGARLRMPSGAEIIAPSAR